jgi:hypothetical protein
MKKTGLYKDYEIQAAPLRLEGGIWNTEVHISRRGKDGKNTDRHFTHPERHRTEEEAVKFCFEYAKQIIDDLVPNCSVADL